MSPTAPSKEFEAIASGRPALSSRTIASSVPASVCVALATWSIIGIQLFVRATLAGSPPGDLA